MESSSTSPRSNPADARPPREIAELVQTTGVAKAETETTTLCVLAVLAGAFISLGALLFTVIVSGSELGFGLTRIVGGIGFCLGLILVVVAGAELFTGNNLIAMAWASRLVSTRRLLRNWLLVYCGNVIGCLMTVALVLWAQTDSMGGGVVGRTATEIATTKANLDWVVVFARGILCNALVCMAIWLSMSGRTVTDKILAILFPITAFVALGFEHSIANWFFLPYGWALAEPGTVPLGGIARNLLLATAGNLIGGTLLVAGIYWLAYLRRPA